MFYILQRTSLAFPCLNLFLFYSPWCYCEWNCYPNFTFRFFTANVWKCNWFLYPATLLNSFITSGSCLLDSLGFSLYKIMSPMKCEFFFFFYNLDAFYFYFLPNCPCRNSNTMLMQSGENIHPQLKQKESSRSPLSMILAIRFSWMPLSGWGNALLFHIRWMFSSWMAPSL